MTRRTMSEDKYRAYLLHTLDKQQLIEEVELANAERDAADFAREEAENIAEDVIKQNEQLSESVRLLSESLGDYTARYIEPALHEAYHDAAWVRERCDNIATRFALGAM